MPEGAGEPDWQRLLDGYAEPGRVRRLRDRQRRQQATWRGWLRRRDLSLPWLLLSVVPSASSWSPAGRLCDVTEPFEGVGDGLIQAGGSALGQFSLDGVRVEASADGGARASTEWLDIGSEMP
jgi:hypothetical protein